MNKKTTPIALIVALVMGASSFVMAEDTIASGGFGDSKLTQVSPVKKKSGECVSFEATFSEPLDRKPSAVLDIERYFTNLLNAAILEVTKDADDPSGKKYRMALTASTTEGCPIIEEDSQLTISTYSGREKDADRQILPESVTFKADKQSRLKKE
jgi:hypothetical protein